MVEGGCLVDLSFRRKHRHGPECNICPSAYQGHTTIELLHAGVMFWERRLLASTEYWGEQVRMQDL